jgi:hypothetical protein
LGFSHSALDQRLQTEADLHGNTNETDGLRQDSYGVRLALGYRQPLTDWLRLGLRSGWTWDRFDREADTEAIEVIDERLLLSDAVPVSLAQPNVRSGSITVSNAQGTQIYAEELDYRVILVSDVTQIQRLPTGNIEDGEEVRVDYAYLTGGTASYTSIGQIYRGDLTLYERLRLYAQYRETNPSLVSGEPTLPLSSLQATLVGAKLDLPFWDGYSAGGRVEHEDFDAEVGPYVRDTVDVYFQMPVVWNGRLRLFASQTKTDRLDSPEDLNLKRYGLRYSARPWRRTDLTAEVTKERDEGGTSPRENTRASLRLSWAYRKLRFTLDGYYNSTQLGGSDTDRARIEATFLALVVIAFWHWYNVPLAPGRFPMQWTFLTGKTTREHQIEEHFLEYLRNLVELPEERSALQGFLDAIESRSPEPAGGQGDEVTVTPV